MPGTRVYIDLKETSHKAIFTMKNISKAPLNISAHELTERFCPQETVPAARKAQGLGFRSRRASRSFCRDPSRFIWRETFFGYVLYSLW